MWYPVDKILDKNWIVRQAKFFVLQVVYSEASHRLLSSIQEDSLVGRPSPNQLLQYIISERPQRTDARLVALSSNFDHR